MRQSLNGCATCIFLTLGSSSELEHVGTAEKGASCSENFSSQLPTPIQENERRRGVLAFVCSSGKAVFTHDVRTHPMFNQKADGYLLSHVQVCREYLNQQALERLDTTMGVGIVPIRSFDASSAATISSNANTVGVLVVFDVVEPGDAAQFPQEEILTMMNKNITQFLGTRYLCLLCRLELQLRCIMWSRFQ